MHIIDISMDYMTASRRFDLNKVAKDLENMPWEEIVFYLQKIITSAEGINISLQAKDRDVLRMQQKYISTLKTLAYLIGNYGGLAPGVARQDLHLFEGVIRRLVELGNVKASATSDFE